MSEWRWRRTSLSLLGGEREVCPDDWTLYDAEGLQVARVMLVVGDPNNGRWRWSLQIRPDGERLNGGQGYCDAGMEARELCESRVPRFREDLSGASPPISVSSDRRLLRAGASEAKFYDGRLAIDLSPVLPIDSLCISLLQHHRK